MIKIQRSQIVKNPNLGVTLNAQQWWKLGWRHARLMGHRWWNVAHNRYCETDHAVQAARRQAPAAFRCLLSRVKDHGFMLWKSSDGSTWFYCRPCKHVRHPWP